MLKIPAPFPQVGSFALLIDMNQPAPQRAELVRILERTYPQGSGATVSFPLRTGASGYNTVPLAGLIDGTPLTSEESAELDALRSHLSQQTRPNRKKIERAEALRRRQIYSDAMRYELAALTRLQSRSQPSIGRILPREAA